jgi:type IV pilus assembly protein PilY1
MLSDIIHSSPEFDLDSNTLYMGSNGGFLHAFNGLTGVEKFGFMPQEVVPRIKNISSVAYTTSHEYFVDGASALGLKIAQTDGKYNLYTLLGRGGKGLFSISPGLNGDAPTLLWEYTPRAGSLALAASSTSIITAAASDPDLGKMLSRPAPVLLNNGKLGLMVGNGYNSDSGKAVVYIFMINQDGSLFGIKKLDSGVAGDNGMAGPAAADFTQDGIAEFVYAGDLKGNVWKFDIRDPDPSKWGLAYSSGLPMFKATDALGNPQPITSAITPVFDNKSSDGRLYLFFGTGSYFKAGDAIDMSIQSWYGINDDGSGNSSGNPIPSVTAGTITTSRSTLVERKITDDMTSDTDRLLSNPVVRYTVRYGSGEVENDMVGKRGWYYDGG